MAIRKTDETEKPVTSSMDNISAATNSALSDLPTIKEILSQFNSKSRLSEDALGYVERIKELLIKERIEVEVEPHNDGLVDVVAFFVKSNDVKTTILLTFNETIATNEAPPCEFIKSIVGGLISDKARIIENLVVVEEDYPLYQKMAAYMASLFQSVNNARIDQMTIESFMSSQYHISTNEKSVKDFIKAHNPQASMPRVDFGVILSIIERRASTVGTAYHQQQQELIPILAIGGYTNLVTDKNNQFTTMQEKPRFIPIVTISSVVSAIPTDSVMLLALPLAADAFINRDGWIKPYTKFGPKDTNIANLLIDPKTGKPQRVKDMNELITFRMNYILPAWLAIDIVDGRSKIKGVENIVYDPNTFQNRMSNFLGISGEMPTLFIDKASEFIGTCGRGTDSRVFDYLTVLAKGITDIPKVSNLLRISHDPALKSKQIAEWWDDYIPLYRNTRVVLNSVFVTMISNIVSNKLQLSWENADQFLDNATSRLLDANGTGNHFANMPTLGFRAPGFNDGFNIYRQGQ